ncbi:hypothetical protein [Novosphingobium sp. CECT 9465]|uniref:hypothetical protein n=1 Tax=Novosphingobium sp. CECT 9465 TaxID=2829794 RepID=UPI001E539E92|nr:hypothetical protein [Novosphingobium sp. CECT 9465]CAH0498831.1 hypothetical protein NVSP9465_03925 [Novosphingobium sp. CECT 9465]
MSVEPLFERFEQCYQRRTIAQNLEKVGGARQGASEVVRQKDRPFLEIGDEQ